MTLWWEGSDDMAGTWWQRIGQGEAEWKKPLKFPSWVTLGWRAFVWARESMGRAAPLVWESVKECILRCSFFFPSAYGLSPCKTGLIDHQESIHPVNGATETWGKQSLTKTSPSKTQRGEKKPFVNLKMSGLCLHVSPRWGGFSLHRNWPWRQQGREGRFPGRALPARVDFLTLCAPLSLTVQWRWQRTLISQHFLSLIRHNICEGINKLLTRWTPVL